MKYTQPTLTITDRINLLVYIKELGVSETTIEKVKTV